MSSKKSITAKGAGKPVKPEKLPRVYKEEELANMIELIESGIWRTTNLSNALGINMETVDKWKLRPEVIQARRKSVKKWADKRVDADKVLKELGMEIDSAEVPLLNVTINQWSDEQLTKFIESEATRRIAGRSVDGDETQGAIEPVEVLEVSQ